MVAIQKRDEIVSGFVEVCFPNAQKTEKIRGF